MAVYMDWPNRIIHVPKNDLVLFQLLPVEIREMSLNWFRMQLKGLEDDPAGMQFPDTHRHNTEVTLGSLTFARVIEIINDYTITFEDGPYAVNLIGANSNVGDKVNVNQVSVRSANSAGMTSSPAIEHASFNDRVTIDTTTSTTGTTFPIGTQQKPVNNLDDALLIAEYRGFSHIFILSDLTIQSGQDVSSYKIISDNYEEVILETGAITTDTIFEKIDLYGEVSGSWNVFIDCWLNTITNFLGWMRGGSFQSIELAPYIDPDPISFGSSYFDDVVPMYANTPAILKLNHDTKVTFTGCAEIVEIRNMCNTNIVNIVLNGGKIILNESCLDGFFCISGVGTYENNSLLEVFDEGLSNADTIANSVWNKPPAEHQTVNSFGEIIQKSFDYAVRSLGLSQENYALDQTQYDQLNNLVSARLRIYAAAASVGTDNDVIATYTITSNWTNNLMDSYEVKLQ